MNLRIALFSLLAIQLPGPVQAADLQQLRQAEKIALSTTGKPLPDAMRKDFLAGKITLDAIADALTRDPSFIEYFAEYRTRTIGFLVPFNAYDLKDAKGESFDSITFRQYPELFSTDRAAEYTVKRMTDLAKNMSGAMQLSQKDCNGEFTLLFISANPDSIRHVIKAAKEGIGPDGNPVLEGTLPIWQQILPIYEKGELACDSPELKAVKPWWDPEKVTTNSRYNGLTEYKAVPLVVEKCGGPDLRLCNTTSLRGNDRFTDLFSRDLMMEPSYIIAHTVAEDRPFSEVLAGSETIMTGTYGSWMANNGPKLWENYPGGAIDDKDHAIFTKPNAADRKHYRIKRGPLHAGILTTPAYQLLTNGRRAKANKAYETFLCRKFAVPEGAQPDPSDSNPDLTKRAYCEFCHKSLEPMAAFFNRWPTTGVRNYIYDKDPTTNDTGRFNGTEGKGAAAFGKIMTESESFSDCSVRRAFEFVNGRKMSQLELDNQLKPYMNQFSSNQMNLRLVIKSMLLKPEFLSPKGE